MREAQCIKNQATDDQWRYDTQEVLLAGIGSWTSAAIDAASDYYTSDPNAL